MNSGEPRYWEMFACRCVCPSDCSRYCEIKALYQINIKIHADGMDDNDGNENENDTY